MLRRLIGMGVAFGLVVGAPVFSALIYDEDFTADPGLVQDFEQQIGVGGLQAGHSALGFDQFAVQGDTGFSTNTGVLHIDSNLGGNATATRKRSASVFVDTSSFTAGEYQVAFVVSNYIANPNGSVAFNVFEGTGLDTGFLAIRTGQNNGVGAYPRQTGGAATHTLLTADTTLGGNGWFLVNFTLSAASSPGDFMNLSWTQSRGAAPFGLADTLDVGNITVTAVPEPSTWAMFGTSIIVALGMAVKRRNVGNRR